TPAAALPMPPSLRELVRDRLAALPADLRPLLELVAALGRAAPRHRPHDRRRPCPASQSLDRCTGLSASSSPDGERRVSARSPPSVRWRLSERSMDWCVDRSQAARAALVASISESGLRYDANSSRASVPASLTSAISGRFQRKILPRQAVSVTGGFC